MTWVRTVVAGVLGRTTLVAAKPAEAADLIVNGNFIAEDFQTAAGWQSMDDKYGSEHQASEMAVWSDDDSAPNYGAILRVCQDGLEAASGSGGVTGAHIEQTGSLEGRAHL